MDSGIVPFRQVMRGIGMLLLISQYVMFFMYWPTKYFFVPLTNWTLIITTMSLGYTMWAAQSPERFGPKVFNLLGRKPKESYTYQARHHFLYMLSLLLNFMVTVGWWTLLHNTYVEKHKDHHFYGAGRELHLKTVHIIPPLVCFMNTFISNCVI